MKPVCAKGIAQLLLPTLFLLFAVKGWAQTHDQQAHVVRGSGADDSLEKTDRLLLAIHDIVADDVNTTANLRSKLSKAKDTSEGLDAAKGEIKLLRLKVHKVSDLNNQVHTELERERVRSGKLDLALKNVTKDFAIHEKAAISLVREFNTRSKELKESRQREAEQEARIEDLEANSSRSYSALRSEENLVDILKRKVALLTESERDANRSRLEEERRASAELLRLKEEGKKAFKERDAASRLLAKARDDIAHLQEQFTNTLQALAVEVKPADGPEEDDLSDVEEKPSHGLLDNTTIAATETERKQPSGTTDADAISQEAEPGNKSSVPTDTAPVGFLTATRTASKKRIKASVDPVHNGHTMLNHNEAAHRDALRRLLRQRPDMVKTLYHWCLATPGCMARAGR